jgi:hypothetical protein
MFYRLPSAERYERDPLFRTLVDTLYVYMTELQITPTEAREAAMLATIKFESMHIRPVFLTPDERERWERLRSRTDDPYADLR